MAVSGNTTPNMAEPKEASPNMTTKPMKTEILEVTLPSATDDEINSETKVVGETSNQQKGEGQFSPGKQNKAISLEAEAASMTPADDSALLKESDTEKAVKELSKVAEEAVTNEKKVTKEAETKIKDAKEKAAEIVTTLVESGVDEETVKEVEDEQVEKVKEVIKKEKKAVEKVKKEAAAKVAEATEKVTMATKKEREAPPAPPAPKPKKTITFEPVVMKTTSVPVCVGEFFTDSTKEDTSFGMCAVKSDGSCPTTLNKMCTTDRDTINHLLTGAKLTMF